MEYVFKIPIPCLAIIADMAPKTATGAKFITYPVTFKMMCAVASKALTTGLAISPNAAAATPKKSANTTICKISFLAIASITLAGNTW